jgi:translocation and assembly module TamB
MGRRFIRYFGAGTAIFAALLALVLAALIAGFFQQTSAGFALWAAGRASGYQLACEEFEGNVFSSFTCRRLTASDAEGVFFRAGVLEFGWELWPALSRRLDIQNLRLSDAEFSRQPISADVSDEPFSLPTWPGVSISFQEFALNRFVVSLPDAPIVCLNGSGNADVIEPTLALRMQFVRCEGEGTVTALIGVADGALSLDVNAADDGALADLLLGWDGAGATDIRLVGSGPLGNFNGTLNGSIVDGGTIALAVTTLPGGAIGVNGLAIHGDVTLAEGRAPEWAPATNGSIAARLFIPDEGGMRVEDGNIVWGAAELNFDLSRSADGMLAGQVDAAIGALDGVVAFQSAMLSANISGDGEIHSVEGTYTLTGFCGGSVCAQTLAGALQATVNADTAIFSTDGDATALRVADAIDTLLGATTGYTASGEYVFDDQSLTAEAAIDGAGGDLQANASVLLYEDVTGSGTATLDLARSAVIGGTTFPEPARLFAELGSFSAAGAASGTLALESAILAANGRFALTENGGIDARLATTRSDAERLSAMTGILFTAAPSFEAQITGRLAAPSLVAHGTLPGVDAGGLTFTDAVLDVDIANDNGAWNGDASFVSMSAMGEIDVAVTIAGPAGEPVLLSFGESQIGGASLTGGVSVPVDGAPATGRVVLGGNVLSPVGAFLMRLASSEGTVTLDLTAQGDAQIASVDIALTHVLLEGQLADATVEGEIVYNAAPQDLDVTVALNEGEDALRLVADGSFVEGTRLTVQSFEGEWSGIAMRALAPFSLTSTEGTATLSPAEFDVGGGRLELSGAQTADALNARVALIRLPVGPFTELAGLEEAEGTVDAEAVVRMTPANSEGTLTFQANDFAFANIERDLLPADLTVNGDWDGRTFDLNGELSGLDDAPAVFTLSLPVRRIGENYEVAVDQEGPLTGSFNGTARAERLLAILPLAEHSLTGAIRAALRVDGTPAMPHFSGQANLTGGTYESLEYGTRFENVSLSLDATAVGDFALDASGTDGGAGRVAMTGRMNFGEGGAPIGNADITITNAYLLNRDEYTVRGSGALSLLFPENEVASFTGNFRTAEVRINMGQPLPPGVQEIAVIEINRPPELGALEPEEEAAGPDFISTARLDFNLLMPNNVRVEGFGVNSEWRGDIHAGGTAGAPAITGEINLVRGFAEFLGREFTLDSGRIVLDAQARGGARVNIAGSHEQNDLRVNLNITGEAAMPDIAWSSVPALPRDEIISRLYFGKSSPQLSAYEAIQLAQMSGALGGFGGAGGVIDFARRVTSLDVLRIEPPAGGDIANPSVTVGKYVTERVYVGARRDAESSSSAIEVQIEVTPSISVEVETGSDNSQAAGVNWQWDY